MSKPDLNDAPAPNRDVIAGLSTKRYSSNPSLTRPHKSYPSLSSQPEIEGRHRAPRSVSANLPTPTAFFQATNQNGSVGPNSRKVQSAQSNIKKKTLSAKSDQEESITPEQPSNQYQFPNSTLSSATHVSTRSRNTSGQHVVYPNPMLSVFWKANDPLEWTMDRVVYWLEYNKFGLDWIETFRSKNLHGEEFLSLVSYQKLKSLGYLSATNDIYDTKPSRFIHILRKVLDRSSSSISNSAIAPEQVDESGDYRFDPSKWHTLSPETELFNIDENIKTMRPLDPAAVPSRSFEDLSELDPVKLRIRQLNRSSESAKAMVCISLPKVSLLTL